MRPRVGLFQTVAVVVAALVTCGIGGAETFYPGEKWEEISSPESVGWSSDGLTRARQYSESINTAAVVIVVEGRILDQWGDTTVRYNVHSVRKSFLSALYGIAIEADQIDLASTLAELDIDDRDPALTDEEKQATVVDLLKSRSGIYHHAAYETMAMKTRRPERGSHPPGEHWYYNNWDFNTLGTIYEATTGMSVFEGFERYLAVPLEMEDFRLEDTRYVRAAVSDHPAYLFRMTARDMARFGLLYLRGGRWRDQQIIPECWLTESIRPHSRTGRSGGFGYMWWVAVDGQHFPGAELCDGSFSARGRGGQYIVVMPEHDLVVVHRVDTDIRGNSVSRQQFGQLLQLILEANEQ